MVKVNNSNFADDTMLIANSENELAGLLVRVKHISITYWLKIRMRKTELMKVKRGDKHNLLKETGGG